MPDPHSVENERTEEIKERFGISKGQFKRALGNLMRQRKIIQIDGETRLVESPIENVYYSQLSILRQRSV